MATEKKYLDFAGLDRYNNKIKAVIAAGDAAAEASAAAALSAAQTAQAAAATAKTEAVAEAKSYTDGQISAVNTTVSGVKTIAEQGVSDAAAAKSAAEAADAKAVAAQGDVDALAGKVGAVPEGSTVMGIINNIQENAYDDTAVRALITENANAIAAEKSRAEGIELGLQDGVDANAAAIAAVKEDVDAFFLDADMTESAKDTLKELQAYISADETGAAAMAASIKQNADDIDALEGRMDTAEDAIDAVEGRMDTAEADIDALQALFGEGDGTVSDMIADAVAAEAALRKAGDEAAEASAAAALKAAQDAQGEVYDLEGVVADLDTVVATKATKAEHDILAGRVTANEQAIAGIDNHSHTNKNVLDGITAELVAAWDNAAAKVHEHTNKDVLDGITAAKVTAWDDAEQNAKNYTNEKIAEFVRIEDAEIDSLFGTAQA